MTRTIVDVDPNRTGKTTSTTNVSGSEETKKSEAGSVRLGGEVLAGLIGLIAVM